MLMQEFLCVSVSCAQQRWWQRTISWLDFIQLRCSRRSDHHQNWVGRTDWGSPSIKRENGHLRRRRRRRSWKRRTSELGPELGQQQQQPLQIATNNRHTVSSYINRWSVDQLNTNRMSQKWGVRERERGRDVTQCGMPARRRRRRRQSIELRLHNNPIIINTCIINTCPNA